MWNRLQPLPDQLEFLQDCQRHRPLKIALSAVTMETEPGRMLSGVRGVEGKEHWHVSVASLIRAGKSILGGQTTKEPTGRSPLARWRRRGNRALAMQFEVGVLSLRLCFKHFSRWLYGHPAFLWLNSDTLKEVRIRYTLQWWHLRAEIVFCRSTTTPRKIYSVKTKQKGSSGNYGRRVATDNE